MICVRQLCIFLHHQLILTFRDENLRLADRKDAAKKIADHTFTIEEFLSNEYSIGNIKSSQFTDREKAIKIHGHCHQKALTNIEEVLWLLSIPENYVVEMIPSGCCGMAGSFGYEKEHYEISEKIGEIGLFPTIRKAKPDSVVIASGFSCRHQIEHFTERKAKHWVEVLEVETGS